MKHLTTKMLSTVAGLAMMASGASAEVELLHDKGFWADALQVVGDAAAENTGNRIVQTPYANAEQYKAFIQTSATGGDMPDLFTWWTGGQFSELIASGQVAPLDALWERMIASGDFDASLRDFYSIDGVAYGVPLHLSRWIALYNTDHFETAGITEPQTWDELLAAAEALKAAGITPFHATTQEGWRGFIWFQEIMIRTNPEAYAGLHDGSVSYDSDAVRNAFQIWSDWYAKGYFTDPRSNDEVGDFARGEGAIYLIGDWAVGIVEGAGMTAGEDFSAFIMPNQDASLPSSAILEGSPIVLSASGAENPDAMAGLEFFVSVEGANAWAASSGNSIGNVNAAAPNAIVEKINGDVVANRTIAIDRWWEAVPAELQGEFVAEFNRFMLSPTMETAETVMSNIEALNSDYWANQ
jgi:multiple sugar transport system substrate-binding protein